MAMQLAGRRGGPIAAINVTPMADVMIVLLIIFMVATPLIAAAPVELPPARHGGGVPDEPTLLVVKADGTVLLDRQRVPAAALPALLAGRKGIVQVAADGNATYADVQAVLDATRAAGAEQIVLEVSPRPD